MFVNIFDRIYTWHVLQGQPNGGDCIVNTDCLNYNNGKGIPCWHGVCQKIGRGGLCSFVEPHFCDQGLICKEVSRLSLGGEAQAKGSGGGFNFDAPIAQCQPYDYSAAKSETGMYTILVWVNWLSQIIMIINRCIWWICS